MDNITSISLSTSYSPEGWVDEHADYLYNFAYTRLHNPALAEDLVQETFLSALKNYAHFRRGSCERTWLVSILKNKIIDQYRHNAHKKTQNNIEQLPGYYESGLRKGRWKKDIINQALPDDISELYDQKEFGTFVQSCLAKMPKRLANVFVMREIDGYSTKEICKALEISTSNVWVILHRARHLIRNCLENNGYGLKEA